MSGLKKYNHKGKHFKKDKLKIWGGVSDNLLSYEEVNDINDFWKEDGKVKNGFCNIEPKGDNEYPRFTLYVPKKTRNKKDIVAAHKRSTKKTNRQQSKKQIKEEL